MVNKTKTSLILNTKYLILVIVLIFGYFLTRLYHLTIIPVFADEAIYIRWAQVMRAVSTLRFLPLSDGKQPLFMWLIIPFLKIFSDPLVAGRMVSVLSGVGIMTGVGVLSYILFQKKSLSFFACLLYVISPFCFFFDRLALTDSLLSFLGIWTLIFFILLVKKTRLDLAMITGIILGLGLLTKSPALIFAIMLPFTLIIGGRNLLRPYVILKLFLLWGVVFLFGFAIYNILRLGPEFHMIAIRNKDYIFSFAEVLKHPLNPFVGNFKLILSWYWVLVTPLVFFSGLLGIFLVIRKNFKEGIFLSIWLFLPLVGQSAIAKVFTARYVLFTVPVFLIFSAFLINNFFTNTKNKLLVIIGLSIIFLFPIHQIILLCTNPQKAWLPPNERAGYLEMWTAGYGIKESAEYLKNIAKTRKVLVGTEGTFGTLPNGLEIYLEKVPNITIVGGPFPVDVIPEKLVNSSKENKIYLLVNDTRFGIGENPRLNLIDKYPKAVNKQGFRENLLLIEIKPK